MAQTGLGVEELCLAAGLSRTQLFRKMNFLTGDGAARLVFVKFHFAKRDGIVAAVNEQVNLRPVVHFTALGKKAVLPVMDAGNPQGRFYLFDVLQANVLKGIPAPRFPRLGLARQFPFSRFIGRQLLDEFEMKKGKVSFFAECGSKTRVLAVLSFFGGMVRSSSYLVRSSRGVLGGAIPLCSRIRRALYGYFPA